MAADNQSLARFELVGIPPAPRGMPQIEVTFELAANGIVNVSAKDLGTGRSQSVRITAQSGLTEAEIDTIITEAQAHQESDQARRDEADLLNRAEALIYTTEQSLNEYGTELDQVDLELIQSDLKSLKDALASDEASQLSELVKALETSAYRIAETIYGQEQSG